MHDVRIVGGRTALQRLNARVALVICAVIGAASCSAGQEGICNAVPDVITDIGEVADFEKNMKDPAWLERRATNCIHRWGYRLASSPDNGATVVKAVMQACQSAVADHVNFHAGAMAEAYQKRYDTGVVTMAERHEYEKEVAAEKLASIERDANFRVQQARAGKCKV